MTATDQNINHRCTRTNPGFQYAEAEESCAFIDGFALNNEVLNLPMKFLNFALTVSSCFIASLAEAAERPNIISVSADDMSTRELPIYESSTWTNDRSDDRSDLSVRTKTQVLDQLAKDGWWVKTGGASVGYSPNGAMISPGRYARLHKWRLVAAEPVERGSDVPLKDRKKRPKKLQAGTETSDDWELAFQDDYEGRTEIGESYSTARGHEDAWSVADGVLVGKQTNDDHGAVIRTEMDFSDVDIQFSFRFSGGTSFNFVIDDKNEKSVHAGHVARVSISAKRLKISDDKTGGMNLEVRKQRKDKNLSAEESAALANLLARTQSTVKLDLQPGKWHTLRIRMKGDIMKAFVDGQLVTSLRSLGFAHPTKTKFGFTVNGQTIDFDNFVVRRPKPVSE